MIRKVRGGEDLSLVRGMRHLLVEDLTSRGVTPRLSAYWDEDLNEGETKSIRWKNTLRTGRRREEAYQALRFAELLPLSSSGRGSVLQAQRKGEGRERRGGGTILTGHKEAPTQDRMGKTKKRQWVDSTLFTISISTKDQGSEQSFGKREGDASEKEKRASSIPPPAGKHVSLVSLSGRKKRDIMGDSSFLVLEKNERRTYGPGCSKETSSCLY